jgi:heme A synthase
MTSMQLRTEGTRVPATYVWLAALTALAIFAQAVLAGQFVQQIGKTSWINAHNMNADLVVVLSLISSITAALEMRSTARHLVIASAVLFVLTTAQTLIGHQITDDGKDWLLAIHVPLAFVIFALSLWLLARATVLRRPSPGWPREDEVSSIGVDQ